jgi:hypothetical protein
MLERLMPHQAVIGWIYGGLLGADLIAATNI